MSCKGNEVIVRVVVCRVATAFYFCMGYVFRGKFGFLDFCADIAGCILCDKLL